MLKLFLKFYLVIAIPLLFLFIPTINPVSRLFNSWAEENYSRYFEGLFTLLEMELQGIQSEKQHQQIKQLNHHFGNHITLIPMSDLTLSSKQINRLQHGETIFYYNKIPMLLKKAAGTTGVLVVNLDPSREDEAYAVVKGPVYLLNKLLRDIPSKDWPATIARLTKQHNFTIRIKKTTEVPVVVGQNPRLRQNKSVRFEHEKNLISIYAPTPAPDWLYQFGPVDERDFYSRMELINRVLPASLLALGILLLAWPLYRDIKRLRHTATALGRGQFDTRTKLAKGASLYPLAMAFNRMAERIRDLISSHKNLTNAVSHELKTPLTRLRFSHEMLRDNPPEDERLRHLNNIERDIGELEILIGELLQHARYDRPVRPGEFETVELRKWLAGIIQPFQDSFPNIDSTFRCNHRNCVAPIEQRAMTRAVENLLNNAFTHADKTVRVNLTCSGEEIIFTVEDDGPGVAKADRQRIFEPFIRLDSSRQRKTGGTGLGLAIARQVARMHNGSLRCDSSESSGACFTMRIHRHGPDRQEYARLRANHAR